MNIKEIVRLNSLVVCTFSALTISMGLLYGPLAGNTFSSMYLERFLFICSTLICLAFSQTRAAALAVFWASLALHLMCAMVIPTEQTSDFKVLLDAAQRAAAANFDFLEWRYFRDATYQVGFVSYQAAILSIFGDSADLKILNAMYATSTAIAVYLVVEKFWGARAAAVSGAAYAIYIPPIVASSLLTNQPLAGMLFAFSAVACARMKPNIKSGALVGVLVGLGNIIRPEGIIFILAFGIYFLFCSSMEGSIRKFIYAVFGMLILYFATIRSAEIIINLFGFSVESLANNNPLWKFVLGLNKESVGRYSGDLAKVIGDIDNKSERDAFQWGLIKESIADIPGLLWLFWEKSKIVWGAPDNLIRWALLPSEGSPALTSMAHDQHILWLALAAIGILVSHRSQSLLPALVIAGFGAIYLLVEIQSRYRYTTMPFISMLVGPGFLYITEMLHRILPRQHCAKE